MAEAMKEQTYEQTFDVGERAELTLRNVRGAIDISGWDKPQVSITAIKKLGTEWGAREAFDETTVETQQDGPRVKVRTIRHGGPGLLSWMGIGRMPPEVRYTIKVPATSEVSVRTVDGQLSVNGVIGSVYTRTVNGKLELLRISGQTIINCVSADLVGSELGGTLAVHTVSGRVSIGESQLASFWAKSVDGNVALETTIDPSGSYEVNTVSGNYHLSIPSSSKVTAELRSVSGRGFCEIPAQITDNRRPGHVDWRAVINGGGATVYFKTVSGDLSIGATEKLARAVALQAPTPPTATEPGQAPAAENRDWPEMSILKAVERGEISVEEAVAKLAELDRTS